MNLLARKILIFCLLFASLSAESVLAQRTIFNMHEYNKKSDLPEEYVKDVVLDKNGIPHFATDKGLYALNHNEFRRIPIPDHKSSFFKAFHTLKDQTILVLADDAIYKLIQCKEYNYLELFIDCNTGGDYPQYPKNIYEDSKNRIWIADHEDIFLYSAGKLDKFEMDKKNKSTSFVRSYQFVELNHGQIIAVSQKGWFYKLNEEMKIFEQINEKSEFNVNSVFMHRSNEFLLGTSKGLMNYKFSSNGLVEEKQVLDPYVIASCIVPLKNNRFLVGTWFQGLLEVCLQPQFKIYPVGGFPSFTVNNMYRDYFGCVWASVNSGVVHLEKQLFSTQLLSMNTDYVKDIVKDKNNVFFLNDKDVYRVNSDYSIETYLELDANNSTKIGVLNDLILIGNENGEVDCYENHELKFHFKLSDKDVTDIAINSRHEAWVISNFELFKLNLVDGSQISYLQQFGGERLAHHVVYVNDSDLIISGAKSKTYLYTYRREGDYFLNLSVEADFMKGKEFWTTDIEIDGDSIFLASTIGLLKYCDGEVERVHMEQFTEQDVVALAKDKAGSLWISGSKGIVRKKGDDITLFTNQDGLPSKTAYVGNMLIDLKETLWLGTSNGLAYAKILTKAITSPQVCIHHVQDNQHVMLTDLKLEVNRGDMILLNVSSPIYPQSKNRFKYCIKYRSVMLQDWQPLSSKKQILVSGLDVGDYQLCIKSKHDGNYLWSDEQVLSLRVNQVWYLQWYTLLLFIIFSTSLVYLTFMLSKKRARNRMLKLKRLVNDKTKDLNQANLELEKLNQSKDKFLSIIAHDLRNPFNAIRGFSQMLIEDGDVMDEAEKKELIETIYRSSDDTYRLLENLLDWAQVQKGGMKVNQSSFNLGELMRENLEIHQKLAALKRVSVEGKFPDLYVRADQHMTDAVIRNLISNAIKYSYPEQKILLELEKNTTKAVVKIADQGVGISSDKLENLFHIDTVSSSNGTSDETGSGLGLMLCKEFIDLNGGAIHVDSEINKGTVFSFTIPLD